MIDLSKTHNLSPVADLWWKELYSFLFNERKGMSMPYYKSRHKRVRCKTYYEKMRSTSLMKLSKNEKNAVRDLFDYYKANFKAITLADFNELRRFAIVYRTAIRGLDILERERVNNRIVCAFSNLYESFVKKHGYKVLLSLNIQTCPFCNRQFVTVCEEVGVRPDFDHFFSKSVYPTLAVSFFNLVPICSTCNKKKSNLRVNNHPYFGGAHMAFFVHEKGDITKISLAELSRLTENQLEISIISSDLASKRSLRVLGIKAIYNTHCNYVANIISKAYAYDRHACDVLVQDFSTNSGTPQDVHSFVWGPYLDLKHQEEMPLSKLTADILDKFGID